MNAALPHLFLRLTRKFHLTQPSDFCFSCMYFLLTRCQLRSGCRVRAVDALWSCPRMLAYFLHKSSFTGAFRTRDMGLVFGPVKVDLEGENNTSDLIPDSTSITPHPSTRPPPFPFLHQCLVPVPLASSRPGAHTLGPAGSRQQAPPGICCRSVSCAPDLGG